MLGFAGCGTLSSSSDTEVEIRASPTPGLRAVYQVKTVATLSGAGVRQLVEAQRTATASQRYTVDVTDVAADSFDVRVATASAPEVVLGRFSREWAPIRFGVEEAGGVSQADLATFPVLGEAFQLPRDMSGRWRSGTSAPGSGSSAFRHSSASGCAAPSRSSASPPATRGGRRSSIWLPPAKGEYQSARFRMSFSGQCWMDLATGFLLDARTIAPGQFTQSGEPVSVELREERTLSHRESRGF